MENQLQRPSSKTYTNHAFAFLLAIIICSCSGDGPGADLTGNFIGTWKSGVTRVADYRTQATWEISKIEDNLLKIKIDRTVWPQLDSDNGAYQVAGELDYNQVTSKNKFEIDYTVPASGNPPCKISGHGERSGEKLKAFFWTKCPDDSRSTTLELVKQ